MKRNKNVELIRTKKKNNFHFNIKINKQKLLIAILVIVVIGACVGGYFLVSNWIKTRPNKMYVPQTNEEKEEFYLGPKDCEDRGEWVNASEYYGLFGDDSKETDLKSALYGDGELKGIVPQGVRVEPVMISYDDFKPYDGPSTYGFLEAYSCESDIGNMELQLGLGGDMNLSGDYDVNVSNERYTGDVSLNLKNMEFYIENLMDYDTVGTEEEQLKNEYGYIKPCLNFNYEGSGKASKFNSKGEKIGNVDFTLEGNLNDDDWNFTADLTGQDIGVFKNGEIYIKCKLPCKYTRDENGNSTNKEGFVTVYFKITEVRIGTYDDCRQEIDESEELIGLQKIEIIEGSTLGDDE